MGAPKKPADKKKGRTTITPSKKVLEFVDARVETGEFANRTHGFERAVRFYMENESLARRQAQE